MTVKVVITMMLAAAWMLTCTTTYAQQHSASKTAVKAVVYVFLAEGCPICEQSTPALKRLAEMFTSQGVEFVGVFPNDFSDNASVRDFEKKFGLPFPLVLDTAQELTRKLDARITPQAIVVLPHGETVYRGRVDNLFVALGKRRAMPTAHDVETALEDILKGALPAVRETKAIGCVIERRDAPTNTARTHEARAR
jgi:peroxiredoxin